MENGMISFATWRVALMILTIAAAAPQVNAAGLTDSQRAALGGYIDDLLDCMSYNSITMRCAELSPHLSNSASVIAMAEKNMDYLAKFLALAAPAAGLPSSEITSRQLKAFTRVGGALQGDCGNYRKVLDAYAYVCKARMENAEGNLLSIVK